MLVSYWDCPYSDYDDGWDGEEEDRTYGCTHPCTRKGICDLDNKYGDEAYCQFLNPLSDECV